jgi:hypothetical protein
MDDQATVLASAGTQVYHSAPGQVTISWVGSGKMVHVEWKSAVSGAALRVALERGIDALSKNRGSRWLADCQSLGPISAEDEEWIDQDWFPRALAAGLSCMAIVLPWRDAAKMNVEDIVARVPETRMQRAYFETVWQGEQWLVRCQQPTSPPERGLGAG